MAKDNTNIKAKEESLNESNSKQVKTARASYSSEIIKKGKYRVFNGTDYETIHLQTTADQVVESTTKKFVSQGEKDTWNSKADGVHNHDSRYYQKADTYTQGEVNTALEAKANKIHGHLASDITTDNSKMFVSKSEKDKWNDTYIKSEINTMIEAINSTIASNEQTNVNAHASLDSAYKAADTKLQTNISNVQTNLDAAIEDLTELINNGGEANTELVGRVSKIEKELPTIKSSVSNLDTRVSAEILDLQTNKADKTTVASDIDTAKTALEDKIKVKADKSYVDTQLGNKADAETTYDKTEVDTLLSHKATTTELTDGLRLKVDVSRYNTDMALKANTADVAESLALKADAQTMTQELAKKAEKVHKHSLADITNAGTVASKDFGTSAGQVPLLGPDGKLADAVLPKIAINEVFTADTEAKAMQIELEVGDIVIVNSTSYLCVDATKTIFAEKFRPLQSQTDTVSKGEMQAELAKKVDNTIFNTYKSETQDKLDAKANADNVFTKQEVTDKLGTKVDKVTGKGLSTNDFTNAQKDKLAGIAENANNYSHPTGDGNLHVPATGTSNSGKVLMATSIAGALSWTGLTAAHVSDTATKKFVTPEQIELWTNGKADKVHTHDQYRLISDSYNKSDVDGKITKMRTIVSETVPPAGSQSVGAVWVEITA